MTPEPKEIGHQVRFSRGLIGLFRRGWWEIPEIMCSSGMALVGVGLGILGCYNYVKSNGDNKEFKGSYVVVRSNDPRAKLIRNPVYTSYEC